MNSNILEKTLVQKAIQVSQPIYACLELLPLCNMNCDMCYVRLSREEMDEKGRLRTVEEWSNLTEQMKEMGTLFVLLTGGEPLLYPGFKELYCKLLELGMIVTINTNGTLIDEEWADFFGKYKPRRINVTVYGSKEQTYQELCHFPGGYQRTLDGIALLKEHRIDVRINGSVTAANMDQMDDIYAIGKKFDFPVHMDTYMVSCTRERNRTFDSAARLLPQEAAHANIKALKNEMTTSDFQNYVDETIFHIEHGERRYDRNINCLAGRCSFAVNWQGEMRPCLTFSNVCSHPFEVGIKHAWDQLVRDVSGLVLHEKCATCKLRVVCKTCVASAFCESGSFDGISEYHCRYASHFFNLLCDEKESNNLDVQ